MASLITMTQFSGVIIPVLYFSSIVFRHVYLEACRIVLCLFLGIAANDLFCADLLVQKALKQTTNVIELTAEETLCLIYLNRLRANPQWESERILFGAEGGISGTNYFDTEKCRSELLVMRAAPPLVYNAELTQAARNHSRYMITNDLISHDEIESRKGFTGSQMFQRAQYTGYEGSGTGENLFLHAASPWNSHRGFIIDWGPDEDGMQSPRGHRISCMSPIHQEIGIALIEFDKGQHYSVTQNFGISNKAYRFIGGVLYSDKNKNGEYDIGEGSGGEVLLTNCGVRANTTKSGSFVISLTHGDAGSVRLEEKTVADDDSLQWKYPAGKSNIWIVSAYPNERDFRQVDRLLKRFEASSRGKKDSLDLWWNTRTHARTQDQDELILVYTEIDVELLHKDFVRCMRVYSRGNKVRAQSQIKDIAEKYKDMGVSAWFEEALTSLEVYVLNKEFIEQIRQRQPYPPVELRKRKSQTSRMIKKLKIPLFRELFEAQWELLEQLRAVR